MNVRQYDYTATFTNIASVTEISACYVFGKEEFTKLLTAISYGKYMHPLTYVSAKDWV